MWNKERKVDLVQGELFPSNLTPVPPANPSIASQERALRAELPEFRVIRSKRRKRSIQAYRQNGAIEIHIPDRLTRREELELIPEMVSMVLTREAKIRTSDEQLAQMGGEILATYLPDFTEVPAAITWRAMRERWGSCTTVDRTIRISDRLISAPKFVLEYVLLHELIHLRFADHGPEFAAHLARYPDGERAEAYLEGFEAGGRSNSDIYL